MNATLPQGRVDYVRALSDEQRATLESDSRKALRMAWQYREGSFRAPMVVRANVAMLRLLRSL